MKHLVPFADHVFRFPALPVCAIARRLSAGGDRRAGAGHGGRRWIAAADARGTLRRGAIALGCAWLLVAGLPALHASAAEEENTCAMCHGTAELWEGEKLRLYVPQKTYAQDVHYLAGVKCADCHGGNPRSFEVPEAHAQNVENNEAGIEPFRGTVAEIQTACATCHKEQVEALAASAHARAGGEGDQRGRRPIACQRCHGNVQHDLVPHGDRRSPVFLDHQIKTCGDCHPKHRRSYQTSVHGRGLERSGLVVTAGCADCHGAHKILPGKNPESSLYPAKVADTCARCHRFIEPKLLDSVHGRSGGPGKHARKPAPGGWHERTATCTDCHPGHHLAQPRSAGFRLTLPNRCGTCHEELFAEYSLSLHGALTDLGYAAAATCSDCHGSHDILPVRDTNSPLAPGENRLATCRKCHAGATPNFSRFHPHANYHDAQRFPLLFGMHRFMQCLIYAVFGFFGVHGVLWFIRSAIHVARHGRPAGLGKSSAAYVRFAPVHRGLHVVVIVSFLGLALTGLPLRYSDQPWAHSVARALGGFQSSSVWHRICAVVTLAYFLFHLGWILRQAVRQRLRGVRWLTIVFGPDSPVPGPRDVVDLVRMVRWFFGRGPKPTFDRWTYWEKFDYWAPFWGIVLIGLSGLMLWFPNLFCRFLPGEVLNIALIVHSEEALLATGFIFAVHFFATHLRPEKFPMDMSLLTGLVTEEELREERPALWERLQREDRLEEFRAPLPSRRALWMIRACGFVALSVGLALLVGIVAAVFS